MLRCKIQPPRGTCRYAAAFAAAVWRKLFAADPLSRAAGDAYRREILSRGAADDPARMLRRVLGGPPTWRPLLEELGAIQARAQLSPSRVAAS
jgi:Zn-dependent oligopeptidase